MAQWHPVVGLQVTLTALVVGQNLDFAVPTGERMLDAYGRVDLAAIWTLNAHWQFFLAVDNLFDADYQEAIGFPAPGITPRGGVQARF